MSERITCWYITVPRYRSRPLDQGYLFSAIRELDSRPLQCLRDGRGDHGDTRIFYADLRPRWNPSEAGGVEQTAALDHRPARFGERRDSELHSAGQRSGVPGRRRPAQVLFPDAQPRKIGAAPDIAERQPRVGRERDEERRRPLWIGQVSRIGARSGRVGEHPEIARCRPTGAARAATRNRRRICR